MKLNSIQYDTQCEYWIYSRDNFNYLHNGLCIKPNNEIDYLTKITTSLITRDDHDFDKYKDCFIVIQVNREILFFGIIESYTSVNELVLISFLDYLDFPINMKPYNNIELDWVPFLSDLLINKYITNEDSFENIPNLVVIQGDSAIGTYDTQDMSMVKLQELREFIFRKHNIVINIDFNHNLKQIILNIGLNDRDKKSIMTSLIDVTNITNIDFSNTTNKLYIYDDNNPNLLYGTYYLHSDGSIDEDYSYSRITPVVEDIKYVSRQEDSTDAEFNKQISDTVESGLNSWEFNNELSLDILNKSNIINPNDFTVGDRVSIHYNNGMTVDTVVSGIIKNSITTTLKFGLNRNTLENFLRKKG